MTKHADLRHATNVSVLLDGRPLDGVARSEALVLLHQLALRERLALQDAEGNPVPLESVIDLDKMVAHFASAGLPRSGRSAAALLASFASAGAPAKRAEPVAPTASDVARLAGQDLARQEHEAELRLESIRAARERHAQLTNAGDAVGASEVAP